MAHRAIAAALAIAGLPVLASRPLIALILFGAALAVFMNARGIFGSGMYRAMVAFMSALWLTLVGVVATLLGLIPAGPDGNFLLLPGIVILGIAASLFVGAMVVILRSRRHRARWPGEAPSGRGR